MDIYKVMGTVTCMSWRDVEFVAKVISVKGLCAAGHNIGNEFVINTHKTGGICGFVYHDLFPVLMAAVMGGSLPWWESPDEGTYECSDKKNQHPPLRLRLELIEAKVRLEIGRPHFLPHNGHQRENDQ